MPQSGVGSMPGSNEWTHRGGGRTHNVTQRTDTHIFTGGDAGRTHNVTQRMDTHIFGPKFLGSMLPQYMALSVTLRQKNFLSHF